MAVAKRKWGVYLSANDIVAGEFTKSHIRMDHIDELYFKYSRILCGALSLLSLSTRLTLSNMSRKS